MQELGWLDNLADNLFKDLGIDVQFTRHFFDRVNQIRGDDETGITVEELAKMFKAAWENIVKKSKFAKITDIPVNAEAVLRDHFSKINLPFTIKQPDKNTKLFVPITVMRKDQFQNKSGSRMVPVNTKDVVLEKGENRYLGATEKVDNISPVLGSKPKKQKKLMSKFFGSS